MTKAERSFLIVIFTILVLVIIGNCSGIELNVPPITEDSGLTNAESN